MPKLDKVSRHKILHTGQNYDFSLHDIFFDQLQLRAPDQTLQSRGAISEQLAESFVGVEAMCQDFKPDAVLILGDTNSGLCALIPERLGIPVFHMEAGNRCYDLSVPEEKNRRIIDHVSSINLPYTELSRQNLLREGLSNNRIITVGNPIREVLEYYSQPIKDSTILSQLELAPRQYIVATAHRAENVDDPKRLNQILDAMEYIAQTHEIIFSCHPRTKERITRKLSERIRIMQPLGFFDWAHLELNCLMALTDSGTVQEEMCLFQRPTVTMRTSTERPETVSCGSNLVTGLETADIVRGYEVAQTLTGWQVPEDYMKVNVSDVVVNIIMGKI